MCSTVQEQITTCGQNAIVKIGERTNIRPQKRDGGVEGVRTNRLNPLWIRHRVPLKATVQRRRLKNDR